MKIAIINQSKHSLPHYETEASAGMDLRANLSTPITLQPMERTLVPTGLFLELPAGIEAKFVPEADWRLKKELQS